MSPLALVALLLSLSLASCGDDDSSQEPPGGKATITYSRSGGIAGTPQSIEIEPDGSARVESGFGATQRTEDFVVPAPDLDEIVEGIESAGMDALDQGVELGCADCYLYDLGYGGETASADSVTITDAYAEATAPLQKLIDEHSAGETKGG